MLRSVARITVYQNTSLKEINDGKLKGALAMQFYSYVSVNIDSSWENLTQKAQVVLPRRLKNIAAVDYDRDGYFNLNPNTFTANIEGRIFGLASSVIVDSLGKIISGTNSKILDPLSQGTGFNNGRLPTNFLVLDNKTNNLIFNDSQINNGSLYNSNGYRSNPLIQRGDIIIIQIGYIITNKKDIFNTIATYPNQAGGNVSNYKGVLSNNLTNSFKKSSNTLDIQDLSFKPSKGGATLFNSSNLNITPYFDIDNRWRPYNRSYQYRGYISKTGINNEGNIVLDCEDYMYQLKRAKVPDFKYTADNGWGLNDIIINLYDNSYIPDGVKLPKGIKTIGGIINSDTVPYPVIPTVDDDLKPSGDLSHASISEKINTSLSGGFVEVRNATIGQVLQKIKDDLNIPIFFRPNTDILNLSPFVYNDTSFEDFTIRNYINVDNDPSIGQENFIFITGQYNKDSDAQYAAAINRYTSPKVQSNKTVNGETTVTANKINKVNGFTLENKQNIISSNLEFRRSDDAPVEIIVKSQFEDIITDPNNADSMVLTKDKRTKKTKQQINKSVGYPGGYTFTGFFLVTKEMEKKYLLNGKLNKTLLINDMEKFGWAMLSRYNYTGLYGYFTTFGYPYVQFSDIITIIDMSFPERSGKYFCKKVVYRADATNGLVQDVYIDYKIPEV